MDIIDCLIWLCTGVMIGGVCSPVIAWIIVHFSEDFKKHKRRDED